MRRLPLLAALLTGLGACGRPPPAPQPVPSSAPPTSASGPRLAAPLAAAECAALVLELGATRSVVARDVYERTFAGAADAIRRAACACPAPELPAWLMVTTTPDRGNLGLRLYEPSAPHDACLAEQVRAARLPTWHLGTDCIGCGPKRYGVFRGSRPADAEPVDGQATISFAVRVSRPTE